MSETIRIDQVSLCVKERPLFEGLSFNLNRGQSGVITGASGTGKTTLLRAIAGFHMIDKGIISLFGQPVEKESITHLRKKMFWLPQAFTPGKVPVKELLDVLFNFRENRPIKPTDTEATKCLMELGLPEDILQRNTAELSGGQLQRVGLGIGLLLKRPLVLLDEPTSQLDEAAKDRVLNAYLAQPEITMLCASHDDYWNQKMDKIIAL